MINKRQSMRESCYLDRPLNVEIGVEYQMMFVDVFINCCREMDFGAPLRFRRGCKILLSK